MQKPKARPGCSSMLSYQPAERSPALEVRLRGFLKDPVHITLAEADLKPEVSWDSLERKIANYEGSPCHHPKASGNRDTWVVQSVKRLTSAQAMISPFTTSGPASGSALTAQSLEPVSPTLLAPPLPLSPVGQSEYVCVCVCVFVSCHTWAG